MTTLEQFKNSDAWDQRHSLPLAPKLNNPFLYCSLSYKIIGCTHETNLSVWISHYADQCNDHIRRLFFRWPDCGGMNFSHDEAIGLAFMSRNYAETFLEHLAYHNGFMDNEQPENPRWKCFMYRFPWAIAYIRRRAGWTLWPWHRIAFALYLIGQAMSHRDDEHKGQDGLLLSWLMRDEMRQVLGTRLAWRFWDYRMRNIGPRWCLIYYLGNDYPVFYDVAPERFQ